MKEKKHELIICVVNSGFVGPAVKAAHHAGITGATVINGRGTAPDEASRNFNFLMQPDKDLIFMIVPIKIRETVMHELYREVGPNTEAGGIIFTMPIDHTAGIHDTENAELPTSEEYDKAEKYQPPVPEQPEGKK